MKVRRNPLVASVITPILPYLIGGAVLYFYGKQILAAIGAKLTDKSVEEYEKDAATVKSALLSPISTGKDIIRYVTGTQTSAGGPVSVKGKQIAVPYPSPKSQEEFRANIAAINKVLGRV
jgi:hypothetical protein